jgi:tungstate transport system substrate-binding protein
MTAEKEGKAAVKNFWCGGFVLFLSLVLCGLASPGIAQDRSIILQSTTSTANSGLYDYILPLFRKKTGITVNVVAVGTGQAIKNAMRGDGDVLLVHARQAEEAFVLAGHGVSRSDVMYNDFIIVGPRHDPAKVAGLKAAKLSLSRIARSKAIFVSRGDQSGTHKKEMALWKAAAIDPVRHSGQWYRETGSGMGATLNAAVGMEAYTLTDRATWISFRNRRHHRILVEGDTSFFNQYGVILVNPQKHRRVKAVDGQKFIDWILSDEGQASIARYRRGGQQLFFPNARRES